MHGSTIFLNKGTLKGDLFEEEENEFVFRHVDFEIPEEMKSYLDWRSE